MCRQCSFSRFPDLSSPLPEPIFNLQVQSFSSFNKFLQLIRKFLQKEIHPNSNKMQARKQFSPYLVTCCRMKVWICSAEKKRLPELMPYLMKIFFFQSEEHQQDLFISIGEAFDEVFLLLDKKSFELLPSEIHSSENSLLIKRENCVRPLKIQISNLGQGGSICAFSTCLANEKIPIFYFSSANSDYLLIEESDVLKSKAIITKRFPVIWTDDETDQDEVFNQGKDSMESLFLPTDLEDVKKLMDTFPDQQTVKESSEGETKESNSSKWKVLEMCSHFPLNVSVWDPEASKIDKSLLELLFYNEHPVFYCYSQIQDEFSLILDEKSTSRLSLQSLNQSAQKWFAFKRVFKRGFHELGIISRLVTPLEAAQCPVLYLSTFKTAFLLVREEDRERVAKIYKQVGIELK